MQRASTQMAGTFTEIMVYKEDKTDSPGTILSGVLLNGLVVVGLLFFVTTFLLMLYKASRSASLALRCCCCCRHARRPHNALLADTRARC